MLQLALQSELMFVCCNFSKDHLNFSFLLYPFPRTCVFCLLQLRLCSPRTDLETISQCIDLGIRSGRAVPRLKLCLCFVPVSVLAA